MDMGLWAQLGKLTFFQKPSQALGRFPPIANAWRSCTVDDEALWRSDFLLDLAERCRFQLAE